MITENSPIRFAYETLTDGNVVSKEEKHLIMEYESGKVAFYDFMSDQYRSGIRNPYQTFETHTRLWK